MCSRGWLACERRLKTEEKKEKQRKGEISEEAGSIAGGAFLQAGHPEQKQGRRRLRKRRTERRDSRELLGDFSRGDFSRV